MLTEAELIKECSNFNSIAQRELYRRYSAKMRGVCRRYLNNSAEAEDVLQEGFIKIFSSIHKYNPTGSFSAWIKRIIVNTAIKYYNKNKKRNTEFLNEEELNIVDEDTQDDDRFSTPELSQEEILESLNILSDSYRIVFNMYFMEDYSHKEIADILGIDEKTSRSRLFRARKSLQNHLFDICSKKAN